MFGVSVKTHQIFKFMAKKLKIFFTNIRAPKGGRFF
jgi:hypothetical protein